MSHAQEKITIRFTVLLVAMLLSGADRLAAEEKVEARGITQAIKLEEVVYGHLTDLNGLLSHPSCEHSVQAFRQPGA